MSVYHVFTGNRNGEVVTTCIEEDTFKDEPNPADYFRLGTTDIENHGTFQPVGPGADWLPDYFEAT